MKQRLLIFLLAAGCIAFGVIGFFAYAGQDGKAPEITVKKEKLTYREGDEYGSLLAGVSAKDNIDGDITDQVFVDKIIQTGKKSAVVYYGVMDQSNNVGTARRKVTFIPHEGEPEEEQTSEAAETDNTAAETDNAAAEAPTAPEEDPGELKPDGARPAMRLNSMEQTIKKGESFDLLGVVKDVVDDKDDRNTLYQHIHADGTYDIKTAGTYKIRYYVTDSNGNASEVQEFTLTVE